MAFCSVAKPLYILIPGNSTIVQPLGRKNISFCTIASSVCKEPRLLESLNYPTDPKPQNNKPSLNTLTDSQLSTLNSKLNPSNQSLNSPTDSKH